MTEHKINKYYENKLNVKQAVGPVVQSSTHPCGVKNWDHFKYSTLYFLKKKWNFVGTVGLVVGAVIIHWDDWGDWPLPFIPSCPCPGAPRNKASYTQNKRLPGTCHYYFCHLERDKGKSRFFFFFGPWFDSDM